MFCGFVFLGHIEWCRDKERQHETSQEAIKRKTLKLAACVCMWIY